ncbi:dTDP-4-dehydrorhamnose reductase [bacterium]|nr:dTDP-4-dehydrorhamnose reductase [bacterium]
MKVAVAGAKGMLGTDILATAPANMSVRGFDINDLDICDPSTFTHLDDFKPDWVINCAAYTQVDKAETDREKAWAVNSDGPANLARWCKNTHTRLVHFSTDYIFPGTGTQFYQETDPPGPVNYYGVTKLAGEEAIRTAGIDHLIFRIQWLYGKNGPNFVTTMLNLFTEKESLQVVNDQFGSPTWSRDVATTVWQAIEKNIPVGTYHLASSHITTWFEFAQEIARLTNAKISILPCPTDAYPRPAKRPSNSRLDCEKLKATGVEPLPDWKVSLKRYLS